MAKYKTGDLFAIPLGDGTFVTGRILLDVKQQCVKPKRIDDASPLSFHNGALLVEIYRAVSEQPSAERSDRLIAGVFTGPDRLAQGDWRIVGNEEVDPRTVEFPETVHSHNMSMYLGRGEVMLQLGPGIDGWNGIKINPVAVSENLLSDICLHYLGKEDSIDGRKRKAAQLADKDLRFNERRDEVYQALGLSPNQSYYEFAKAHGHDLARFY